MSISVSRRLILSLFFFLIALVRVQADLPDIKSISPDQNWVIHAHWITLKFSEGYDWNLQNLKTGEVYFQQNYQDNDALPHRFGVLWSEDSRYAAVTLYYGRLLGGVNLIRLPSTTKLIWRSGPTVVPQPISVGKPEIIDEPLETSDESFEKSLLKADDVESYTGAMLNISADRWINSTDVSVGIDAHAFLQDKKSGERYLVNTGWHKTIRLSGKTSQVIASTCDYYDKRDNSN